jgi:hypothetical protein
MTPLPSPSVIALFASPLQPSERPSAARVRAAIAAALDALGEGGCLARLAQEFGDHPEIAVARMRWARATFSRAEAILAASASACAPTSASAMGASLPVTGNAGP